MTEVEHPFEAQVRGPDGQEYRARICGRSAAGGRWEGWVEFEPVAGGAAVSTDRETTQPNRADLSYWASGLTATYLEGALARALHGSGRRRGRAGGSTDVRAGRGADDDRPDRRGTEPRSGPALDPFAVHAEGVGVLRTRLQALTSPQLRTIARAYGMAPDPERLELLGRSELASLIVDAVSLRAR
jgi:hypothetical protein